MKKNFYISCISFILVLFFCKAYAALPVGLDDGLDSGSDSPLSMLRSISEAMISDLNANKSTIKSNPKAVFNIVHETLLPHVNMEYLSKTVVGRTVWLASTTEAQRRFTRQFTTLLIHTYAAALAAYTDQKIEFFPLRGEDTAQATQLRIKSQIIQSGGPPIPISYLLIKINRQWQIVDFSVDNVSIAENFRAQFAQVLSQSGLEGLNKKLAQREAQ